MKLIKCPICETEFEGDETTTVCPSCGNDLPPSAFESTPDDSSLPDQNAAGQAGDLSQPAAPQNNPLPGQSIPNQPVNQQPPVPNRPPVNQQPPVPNQPPVNQQPPVPNRPPMNQQPPVPNRPPVNQQPPAQNQPPMNRFCMGCGTKLQPGLKFCTICGKPVPQVNPAVNQNQDWTKKAGEAVNEATDAVVDVSKKAWKKTKDFFSSL